MRNKKGQITIGKWHFKLGVIPIYWRERGVLIHLGIFKPTGYQKEGELFSKQEYKGFWLRKELTFNGFEISF